MSISVLIADASETLLGVLARFLGNERGVVVLGLASDGRDKT